VRVGCPGGLTADVNVDNIPAIAMTFGAGLAKAPSSADAAPLAASDVLTQLTTEALAVLGTLPGRRGGGYAHACSS